MQSLLLSIDLPDVQRTLCAIETPAGATVPRKAETPPPPLPPLPFILA